MCRAIGVLPKEIFELLKKLNALRDKFAHHLGFGPSFNEIFALVKKAGKAGLEFSDSVDGGDAVGAKESDNHEHRILKKLSQNPLMEVPVMCEDGL